MSYLRLFIFSDSTPFTDSLFLFLPAEYSVSRDVQSGAIMNNIQCKSNTLIEMCVYDKRNICIYIYHHLLYLGRWTKTQHCF